MFVSFFRFGILTFKIGERHVQRLGRSTRTVLLRRTEADFRVAASLDRKRLGADFCAGGDLGLEQNWYPTSFQNMEMQTITSHVDENVSFLGSGPICHRCEKDNYREERPFHGGVYTKSAERSQPNSRNCFGNC